MQNKMSHMWTFSVDCHMPWFISSAMHLNSGVSCIKSFSYAVHGSCLSVCRNCGLWHLGCDSVMQVSGIVSVSFSTPSFILKFCPWWLLFYYVEQCWWMWNSLYFVILVFKTSFLDYILAVKGTMPSITSIEPIL